MVELAYIYLILISNIIAAVELIDNGGDVGVIIFLCISICLLYILGYKFYLRTQSCSGKSSFSVKINVKRLHVFIFILTLATLIFSLMTGVGVSEQDNRAAGSQLFSLFNVNAIFMLYYIAGRRQKCVLYWLNILLYITLRLSQGWSGILFHVFMYEAFFYFGNKRLNKRKNRAWVSLAVVIFIIFAGGFAYSFVSPFKYAIRVGNFNNFTPLPISEAINRLLMRFSILPSSYRSIISFDKILEIYQAQPKFAELQAMLRPLLPRSFMPFKEFFSMGSSIAAGMSGIMNYNISDSAGILIFAMLLLKADAITFVFWLGAYILSFIFIYKLIKNLQKYNGEFSIFYFFVLLGYFETGNVETMFTQSYLKVLFFIPLFILFGIVKIKNKAHCVKATNSCKKTGGVA